MTKHHGCKGCPVCDAGFTKPTPDHIIKEPKCPACGHHRCPNNPSYPKDDDEPDNAGAETPHKKPVLTTGGQLA